MMRDGFRVFGYAALAMLGVYVLGFLATGGNLAIYRFWAPQVRDAQREVFEQSQSYVQGKAAYISRLLLQYEAAEGPQREALRRQVLLEAATVDQEDFSVTLRARIDALR